MKNTDIVKTFFLKSDCTTTWQFLTEKEKIAQWFHPLESDLQSGEEYCCYTVSTTGERERLIWGKVLEMQEPVRLAYTFCLTQFSGRSTTVIWQLEAVETGTKLTLTHQGIPDAVGENALPLLMALDKGWEEHVGKIRALVA